MLSQEYSDEKLAIALLILGAGLLFYHFWQKKKATLLFTIGGVDVNALALSGTNLLFSQLTDYIEEERKRHDLVLKK